MRTARSSYAVRLGSLRSTLDQIHHTPILPLRKHPLSATKTSPLETDESGNLRRGLILGMLSAVGYSAANLALRGLSGRHEDLAWSIWVSAMKALPTVILATCLLLRRKSRGETLYPSTKPILLLIGAALVMQFGGNLGFQLGLGHIGLAITVPLVFAFIICAGAILGKTFLGDALSHRTVVSMLIMTVSVILLSYAAKLAADDQALPGQSPTNKIVWLGITMAVISGISYGINGVVIRKIARDTLPIESMLIIYSSTGLLCLSSIGSVMMGSERLLSIQPEEWLMMMCAGSFNAFAFFCITHSLKLMNISKVNVINASQNAMCAVGAVLIFHEPVSTPLVLGISLSIAGLMTLDRK